MLRLIIEAQGNLVKATIVSNTETEMREISFLMDNINGRPTLDLTNHREYLLDLIKRDLNHNSGR